MAPIWQYLVQIGSPTRPPARPVLTDLHADSCSAPQRHVLRARHSVVICFILPVPVTLFLPLVSLFMRQEAQCCLSQRDGVLCELASRYRKSCNKVIRRMEEVWADTFTLVTEITLTVNTRYTNSGHLFVSRADNKRNSRTDL